MNSKKMGKKFVIWQMITTSKLKSKKVVFSAKLSSQRNLPVYTRELKIELILQPNSTRHLGREYSMLCSCPLR
jgi:hypothetical protein